MFKLQYLLGLFVLHLSFIVISTTEITQEGNCKAILDDGRVIDLKPLDNPDKPL